MNERESKTLESHGGTVVRHAYWSGINNRRGKLLQAVWKYGRWY